MRPADGPVGPQRKRWSAGRTIFVVLGIGGLLVFTCIGGMVWFIFAGKAKVEPTAAAFLDAVSAEDYAAAYEYVGPEWRQVDNFERFAVIETRLRDILGPPANRSLTMFSASSGTGGGHANMEYKVQFANGNATVKLALTDASGEWRVIAHRVESPLIAQAQTCRQCGAFTSTMGPFCSQCGAELSLPDSGAP